MLFFFGLELTLLHFLFRPMRFDHQGNYPGPPRHHHHVQMMRPMHDNYGMRHQRPPINLASAVSQNIQQRYGTGLVNRKIKISQSFTWVHFFRIIDDPLEAFNRIMREKEIRKERERQGDRRSRSFERKRSPMHQYSPDNRRPKNYPKTRKRSRSFKRSKSRSYTPR